MPALLLQDGYRFFFYSNDHEPIHVHVEYGSGEAKFRIDDEVTLIESHGMKISELSGAQELAEKNAELFRRKWHERFG